VVLLLKKDLVSWLSTMDEHDGHKDLRGSGHQSVIPYVHGVNIVVLLKSGLTRVRLSLFFFFDPLDVASTRAFYTSRSGSYNESQGPTGGIGAGKTLCCRAPPARSSK
jgi:hypothetical protein